MHDRARQFVAAWAAALEPCHTLEVGSLIVNTTVRDLFPGRAYVGLDRRPGPGVDVVADGATWEPPEGRRFGLVLCCETLEHAPDPGALCRNLLRLAEPGGVILVTAAGPGREPHGQDGVPLPPGEHYQAIYEDDLRRWLAGAAVVLTGLTADGQDVTAVAVV